MSSSNETYDRPGHGLTERERTILRLVVESFIDTAGPVGSRSLARRYSIGLSPASIRNTMSDLESLGYLDHPYTSAGRVPTELGYRKFVDELMESPDLTPLEKKLLKAEIERLVGNTDDLLRESSRLLGRLSNLLGVVLGPRLSSGVLERIEVVPLTSSRVMFVLSVHGGLVKTIVLELDAALRRGDIDRIVAILNERLTGLTLQEIRKTFDARVRDLRDDRTGIVRLVLNAGALLFADSSESRRFQFAGAQNMLQQPEFQDPDDLRNLIGILEDEDYVVHLLEDRRTGEVFEANEGVSISIGREHVEEKAEKYSIITAQYRMGATVGTIGVIGPTRMDYPRAIALVQNMATLLSAQTDQEASR